MRRVVYHDFLCWFAPAECDLRLCRRFALEREDVLAALHPARIDTGIDFTLRFRHKTHNLLKRRTHFDEIAVAGFHHVLKTGDTFLVLRDAPERLAAVRREFKIHRVSIRKERRVFAEYNRIRRIDLVDEAIFAFGERRALGIRLAVERDECRRIVREHAILAYKPLRRVIRPGDLRVVKSARQQIRP